MANTTGPAMPLDMMAALNQFDAEADNTVRSFIATVEAKKPPSLIFHYTNDVGLRGILETGKFWLTDIFNLNDPSELRHGFSHVIELLKSRLSDDLPERRVFTEDCERFSKFGIPASAHYFVCCFSGAGDDLGQWRAYADNGRGFAMAFDTSLLEAEFVKGSDTEFAKSTFPVTYSDDPLSDLHERLVDKVLPLISLPRDRSLNSNTINTFMSELSVIFTMHAVRAGLFLKHKAYSNEQEYRFLEVHRADVSPPNVKYRNRPYELVRYREFDWHSAAAGSLQKIRVGPAADFDKAKLFVQDCLAAFHKSSVKVVRSKIPYRVS